jgi:hypothetical protein
LGKGREVGMVSGEVTLRNSHIFMAVEEALDIYPVLKRI